MMSNNSDLIDKDRARSIVDSIIQGLKDIQNGDVVKTTAMEIFNEDEPPSQSITSED
jgi:hypothetical protein